MAAPVRGVDELNKAFGFASKQLRRDLPSVLKAKVRPIEQGAEVNAQAIGAGVQWSQMRTAATRHGVYIAPQQRGTRIASRKRPKFGPRLLNRAMIPALERNRSTVGKAIDDLVALIVRKANRG